ncbi:rhodanese-like domain-containing protein [Nitrosomonas sp. JL21]|nr:rhodanese-like domain-containing protein [Nitrosomonas sp. JL21]MBL8497576.1 rhodanese-like domain-containing protein [Nitrosomonas sp.]MXS77826.1 rhodanese-like domain-containing protein [Nitrosomonas sp. JL21]
MELSLFQDQSHFLLRLENLLFVITAVISGALLLWPLVTQRGIKEIDTRVAIQLINQQDAVILDVRDDSEFAAGHLPNSKHIPSEKIEERWVELQKFKEKPIVMIYRSGIRSNHPSSVLRKNGFAQVFNLMGGIDTWKRANLPIVKR